MYPLIAGTKYDPSTDMYALASQLNLIPEFIASKLENKKDYEHAKMFIFPDSVASVCVTSINTRSEIMMTNYVPAYQISVCSSNVA